MTRKTSQKRFQFEQQGFNFAAIENSTESVLGSDASISQDFTNTLFSFSSKRFASSMHSMCCCYL